MTFAQFRPHEPYLNERKLRALKLKNDQTTLQKTDAIGILPFRYQIGNLPLRYRIGNPLLRYRIGALPFCPYFEYV
jgi:hypothetical protein